MSDQTEHLGSLRVGDALPTVQTGPISRHNIALYAAGSSDLNPIHTDIDFARNKAGLPDVIVHGMFVMGYLAKIGTEYAPAGAIRRIKTQFRAMTNVGDNLVCTGKVTDRQASDGAMILTCALAATRQDDDVVVATGEIDIAFGVA